MSLAFLIIKLWVLKEKHVLVASKPSGKCYRRGKLFFVYLANFWTEEKSILDRFLPVLFICCVSYDTQIQQFKHGLNEKNSRWLIWNCLKWLCRRCDACLKCFLKDKSIICCHFFQGPWRNQLNYVFGCQNIAHLPFLRKGKCYYSLALRNSSINQNIEMS